MVIIDEIDDSFVKDGRVIVERRKEGARKHKKRERESRIHAVGNNKERWRYDRNKTYDED